MKLQTDEWTNNGLESRRRAKAAVTLDECYTQSYTGVGNLGANPMNNVGSREEQTGL